MDKKFDDLINYIDNISTSNKVKKKKNYFFKLFSFIISLCSVIFLVSAGYFIKIAVDNKNDFNDSKSLIRDLINTNDNSINFSDLIKKNSDTVGWLKIPNTNIDYPVVKSDNNNYYLNNDFYKKHNVYGWIFADFKNGFPILSWNTIIYGHNTSVGIMFGDLINFLDEDWYKNEENKYIYFSTTEMNYKFEIFSVYKINNTNDYLSIENKDGFIDMIKNRSFIKFNTTVSDEKIITLSTCYNTSDVKLVIHAKMVNF